MNGPSIPIAVWADKEKYRQKGEEFNQKCGRIAGALSDNEEHYKACYDILRDQRFLPGGRVQSAAGSVRETTAFNCFVMPKVPDNMEGIMEVAKEAALTMKMGGGVGYDFSGIRPKGARIKSLDSSASGAVSFMHIFDSVCGTICSAGHRRGAQMACLRVDHPDIMEFVTSKNNHDKLTNFNISVLVTDSFMEAVKNDEMFDLVFEDRVHDTVKAVSLWDTILRSTWDWAEPGVIFIDRVNQMNNLFYCEEISATNPCGEQPLPPYGACLLGSINWTKYIIPNMVVEPITDEGFGPEIQDGFAFDDDQLMLDIPHIVRMMDNVIDETVYPLPEQEKEAKDKRRMGLGHTGVANALELLGFKYGTSEYIEKQSEIMKLFANEVYIASVNLAIEKGPFPLFNKEMYDDSRFVNTLDEEVRDFIYDFGIRNSHLLSIAPTGTISLTADNISSGIEPVFSHSYERTVIKADGTAKETVEDYAYRVWGIKCTTSDEVSVEQHVDVLNAAQKYVDSSVSKTCNVGASITWPQFKDVYMRAYDGGAKGCTTFRAAGKRFGILNASASEDVVEETTSSDEVVVDGAACYIDPDTGIRSCE